MKTVERKKFFLTNNVEDGIIYKLSHEVTPLQPQLHVIEGAKVAENRFLLFLNGKKYIFTVGWIAKV